MQAGWLISGAAAVQQESNEPPERSHSLAAAARFHGVIGYSAGRKPFGQRYGYRAELFIAGDEAGGSRGLRMQLQPGDEGGRGGFRISSGHNESDELAHRGTHRHTILQCR